MFRSNGYSLCCFWPMLRQRLWGLENPSAMGDLGFISFPLGRSSFSASSHTQTLYDFQTASPYHKQLGRGRREEGLRREQYLRHGDVPSIIKRHLIEGKVPGVLSVPLLRPVVCSSFAGPINQVSKKIFLIFFPLHSFQFLFRPPLLSFNHILQLINFDKFISSPSLPIMVPI